jgi:hypothetical protein
MELKCVVSCGEAKCRQEEYKQSPRLQAGNSLIPGNLLSVNSRAAYSPGLGDHSTGQPFVRLLAAGSLAKEILSPTESITRL